MYSSIINQVSLWTWGDVYQQEERVLEKKKEEEEEEEEETHPVFWERWKITAHSIVTEFWI